MGWSSGITRRTDSYFATGSAVGATDEELEALHAAQRAKASQLASIVSQVQPYIAKINEVNEKIDAAKACEAAVSRIPGLVSGVCSSMSQVGTYLQSGLILNGTPVGVNVENDGTTIMGNINSGVQEVKGAVQEYCSKKSAEGNEAKSKAESLRSQYNSVLASYPPLGGYGPAPAFPYIPEVKSY